MGIINLTLFNYSTFRYIEYQQPHSVSKNFYGNRKINKRTSLINNYNNSEQFLSVKNNTNVYLTSHSNNNISSQYSKEAYWLRLNFADKFLTRYTEMSCDTRYVKYPNQSVFDVCFPFELFNLTKSSTSRDYKIVYDCYSNSSFIMSLVFSLPFSFDNSDYFKFLLLQPREALEILDTIVSNNNMFEMLANEVHTKYSQLNNIHQIKYDSVLQDTFRMYNKNDYNYLTQLYGSLKFKTFLLYLHLLDIMSYITDTLILNASEQGYIIVSASAGLLIMESSNNPDILDLPILSFRDNKFIPTILKKGVII